MAWAAAVSLSAAAAAEQPNVVLIVSDDQGWWDAGVNGNPDIETAHLDRLAREGVQFTRFYAAPVCAPTRAGLMTGRYSLRAGVYNTRFGGDTLHAGEVLLPELLKTRGYVTGIFGKWHLGGHARYRPSNRGFDEALGFTHGHHERYYYPELRFHGEPVSARGYISDVFTDAAEAFVRRHKRQPFFLYVAHNVPHSPHFVDDEYIEKYLAKGLTLRDARIYGMITKMDEGIGRLLDTLDREGLRENTIVVFLGDNGGVSRHFSAGLRGRKGSVYEGGVRVPFFARWPQGFAESATVDAMASHLDLVPTLCELLGIEIPSNRLMDGKSLLPLLRDGRGESPHEYLVHHWDRHFPRRDRGWAVSERRYKLVVDELYDLEADPGEQRNIAAQHPEIATRLRAKFEAWFEDVTGGLRFEPVPIEVGRSDENPVEIQMSWASLNGTHTTWASPGGKQTAGPQPLGDETRGGTVNYTFAAYDWDTIDGWRRPGESVSWRLRVVRAGRYHVLVSYGCDPTDAGGRFRLSVGRAALEATVEATPARNIFQKRSLGELFLEKGPAWLEVTALSVPGSELMALNRVWLRRVE